MSRTNSAISLPSSLNRPREKLTKLLAQGEKTLCITNFLFFFGRKEYGPIKSNQRTSHLKTSQPTQAQCHQCLPTGRPPKTPDSLRKRGCKRRTACGTTAFSKQETKRTVSKEERRVHGRLPIAQRTIVPLDDHEPASIAWLPSIRKTSVLSQLHVGPQSLVILQSHSWSKPTISSPLSQSFSLFRIDIANFLSQKVNNRSPSSKETMG